MRRIGIHGYYSVGRRGGVYSRVLNFPNPPTLAYNKSQHQRRATNHKGNYIVYVLARLGKIGFHMIAVIVSTELC